MSSIISWKYTIQAVPSKKKKTSGRKEERKTRWKRGEEEKRDGNSLCGKGRNKCGRKEETKKGRMRCGKKEERKEGKAKEKEKETKGEEEKEETKIEKVAQKNVPPSPDIFPSTKLWNNLTPIKGRLRKSTTPTSRSPTKLNQNLQVDPRRRRSNFDVSSRADFSYAPEEAEYPKYKLHSNKAAIYKKAKALGNSHKRFKFSINQH